MIRAPRQEPSFHIFVPDVVAGLHLPIGVPNFPQHSLLVGNVGFDGIGDQKVCASARLFGQLRKAFLDIWF
jgi:hypothetical protein